MKACTHWRSWETFCSSSYELATRWPRKESPTSLPPADTSGSWMSSAADSSETPESSLFPADAETFDRSTSLHLLFPLKSILSIHSFHDNFFSHPKKEGVSHSGASINHCWVLNPLCALFWKRGLNLVQINLSYTAVTDVGMMAVANMSCIQDMKLVHMKNVTIDCFAKTLLACGSLRKVKLLTALRITLPPDVINQLEDRGVRLRWMDKPA